MATVAAGRNVSPTVSSLSGVKPQGSRRTSPGPRLFPFGAHHQKSSALITHQGMIKLSTGALGSRRPLRSSTVRMMASASEKPSDEFTEVLDKASDDAEEAVDGAAEEVSNKASGLAEDIKNESGIGGATAAGKRGAAVYGALAGIFLAVGVAKAAAPGAALELVYNACGNGACEAFMRISGIFCLIPAVALYCLKGAAENSRLGSATYERLNMSLMITGLGCSGLATAAAVGSTLATSNFIWGVVALGVITAAASGHVLARGETGLVTVASRVPSEALQLTKPANKIATFYAGLTVAVAAMAAALLFAPGSLHSVLFSEASSIGALPVYIKRIVGMLMITAVATTFTLKDAADRSRLGASTFKLLNLAFSVCSAGTLGTMAWYVHKSAEAQFSAYAIGMFVVLAAAAVTCGYQYAFAEK